MALKDRIWYVIAIVVMSIMTYIMKDYSLFLAVILGVATVVMVMMIIAVSLEPNE
jgi:hypothetical protein